MRIDRIAILLGLTTATFASTQLSTQAATMSYQVQSGTTSFSLEKSLSPLGLPNKIDFKIIPPSNNPQVVGTNFTFSYDDQTKAVTPLSGTIEYTGSVAANLDTTKLALLSPFEIGDFSLGYSDTGYFLKDNVSTGLNLFDVKLNNAPTFDGTNLLIEGADVLVSQEFDTLLDNAAGYDLSLTGYKVAQANVSATAVPEPENNLAVTLLIATGMAVTIKRQQRAKKVNF